MGRILFYIVSISILCLNSNYCSSQSISTAEIDSLQILIESEQDDSVVVNFLSSISYNYRDLNSDSAIHYGLKTLIVAEEISSDFRIARVKRFIADTYEQAALLPEARLNYEAAIEVFERLEKKEEVATTLLSLSIVLTKEFKK